MPYEYPKYPANIFTDTDYPDQEDNTKRVYAWLVNALKEELQAALTELGTNPKGSYASVKARLEGIAAGGHITIVPLSYYVAGQGTWKNYQDSRLYLSCEFVNDTIANHDNVSWKITLPKGTYTLLVVGNTGPNMGILNRSVENSIKPKISCQNSGPSNSARRNSEANLPGMHTSQPTASKFSGPRQENNSKKKSSTESRTTASNNINISYQPTHKQDPSRHTGKNTQTPIHSGKDSPLHKKTLGEKKPSGLEYRDITFL